MRLSSPTAHRRPVGEDREDQTGRGWEDVHAPQAWPPLPDGPDVTQKHAVQVAEIERDRRLERRLVLQSLLAILVVVALVVAGRLLTP